MPSPDSFDPSIIVFAALAVFVLWKLRSVFGVRTGRDTPASSRSQHPRGSSGVIPLPGGAPTHGPASDRWKGLAEPGSASWTGMDAIVAADPRFSGTAFVEGARKAYEMIVSAFAKGDRDTLRGLLSKEVFDNFATEIDTREQRGETAETALVSIDSATIDDARANPRLNQITVRFVSKLISARRDRAGEIIEGGSDGAEAHVDLWTFARDPGARDPNWKLVATETAH